MPSFIEIQNDGAEITSTNYFEKEHARRGSLYFSANAACFRILVPKSVVDRHLEKMRTGKSAEIERRKNGLVIWFLDGSDTPYRVEVSTGLCDHMPIADDAGRDDLTLAIWSEGPTKLLEMPAKFCGSLGLELHPS